MAVLAPPVQVVASGAPPFVQVPSGAPPFVVTTGPAPPITIVASGAPPITLFNADGSIWSAHTPAGGEVLLVGEANGFATDFLHPVDAERVALKSSGSTLAYAVDSFFTQSGTSPKMVYDAAGTLGWSPHNRLLQSQTLDNAYWSPTNLTATANATVAPDGTTTADGFIESTANGVFFIEATGSLTGTFSIYAKTNGRAQIMLAPTPFVNSDIFDLVAGTILPGTLGGASGTAVITNVGNGWWRCSMSVTSASTVRVHFAKAGNHGYLGDGVSGVYLWGAQANNGSVPTAYLPTTTAARVGLALDYDPVTHAAKGLLCEPQATNGICPSVPPTASAGSWNIRGATSITLGHSDPTGGTGAALASNIQALGVAEFFHAGSGGFPPGTPAAPSFFIKKVTTTGTLRIQEPTGSTGQWDLNLSLLSGGWERITSTHPAVTINIPFTGSASSNVGLWFLAPTGTLAFYLWGCQVETGTVATSPIPTLAATVTRAADNISALTSSFPFSLVTCSMSFAFEDHSGGASDLWAVNGGSSAEAIGFYTSGFYVRTGGAFQALVAPTAAFGSKAAGAAAVNDFRAAYGGVLSASPDTSGAMPSAAANTLNIGGIGAVHGSHANMHLSKIVIVPRSWSNAELQTRST